MHDFLIDGTDDLIDGAIITDQLIRRLMNDTSILMDDSCTDSIDCTEYHMIHRFLTEK